MGQDVEQGKGRNQEHGPVWEQSSTYNDAGYANHEMSAGQRERLTQYVLKQIRGEFLGLPSANRSAMMKPAAEPNHFGDKATSSPAEARGSAASPNLRKSSIESAKEAAARKNIGAALGEVVVQQQTKPIQLLDAGKIFALYHWNTEEKKKAFDPLKDAAKAVREAVTPDQKQKAQADFATAARGVKDFLLSEMPRLVNDQEDMKALSGQIKAIGLKIANSKKKKDTTTIAQLQEALVAKQHEQVATKASITESLTKKIATLDCSLVSYQQKIYDIVVDGEPVHLHDGIESYATTSLQGLDGKATNEKKANAKKHTVSTVHTMLESSAEKGSVKKILKTISSSEGGFSTVNTYDKKDVTWGFVQWAGGYGSDLAATLAQMKTAGLHTFEKRFSRYGIDVEQGSAGWDIVLNTPEGEQKRGAAAAEAIRNSPTLTAVLARAGMDPVVQRSEIRAAASGQIEKPLRQTIKLKHDKKEFTVRLEQIFTSEYAVGVLADRVVHGGLKKDKLEKQIQGWMDKKGYSPEKIQEWSTEAEQALIKAVAAGWSKRAHKFEGKCSKEPGSFQ